MEYYSTHINKLIEQLSHLPGIGPKSAQRHHGSQREGLLLQELLHADRSGALPDLQQSEEGCRHDYGSGEYKGSGCI